MPKICYEEKAFRAGTLQLILLADQICRDYEAQGLRLSLRQLYYVLVSRAIIPNQQKEYKRLGNIIGEARMAGLIDWSSIEDRGRSVNELPHWASPQAIMDIVGETFQVDKWANQPYLPFVMVEKDALSGVFEPVCQRMDVPFFACKGYPSLSAMWSLGRRLRARVMNNQQTPVILHFGDHDPSGLDMTRDLGDRLSTFIGRRVRVDRLALNYDQVQLYDPPPNPAKESDSRFADYAAEYGEESWELDALEPTTLADLIEGSILALRQDDIWDEVVEAERIDRERLSKAAKHWDEVVELIESLPDDDDDDEE